jgi:hypothetical protein
VADSFTVVAVYVNRDLKIRAKKGEKIIHKITHDPLPQTLGYDCCWLNLTLGNQGMLGSSLIEAVLKMLGT